MHTKLSMASSNAKVLLIGAATVASAFFVGIQTAGEVQPIALIQAGSGELPGDLTGDGALEIDDAIVVLEIVEGYRDPTPEELRADPNRDGLLTVSDALRILEWVHSR